MNKSTVALLLDLLKVSKFHNESEYIDIAKGKYKLPLNFKDMKNAIKRTNKYNELNK